MPKAIYIVIFSQGKWWVDFEGKAVGPFPDKDTAARDAVRLARSTVSDRPFEIWMALPEGLQRLGSAAMRERYPSAPAAPVTAPTSQPAPAVAPLLAPSPALIAPAVPMPPTPTRLPPAPALI